MPKTTEERIANITHELNKAQQKLERERELLAGLPNIPIGSFCVHDSYINASIKIEVETFADVEPILAQLPPEPLCYLKGTFSSFRPEPLSDKDQSQNTVTLCEPWKLQLHGGKGFGPETTVEWFHRANGNLYSVAVTVKLARLYPKVSSHGLEYQRIVDKYYPPDGFEGAQLVSYWQSNEERYGKTSYNFVWYWHRGSTKGLMSVVQGVTSL